MTVMSVRVRREPPRFRMVEVRRVAMVNACLARVTLGGSQLEGFAIDEPAASVRLLLPYPASRELVIPTWNGNEFLLADGQRPVIRTLTPSALDRHDAARRRDRAARRRRGFAVGLRCRIRRSRGDLGSWPRVCDRSGARLPMCSPATRARCQRSHSCSSLFRRRATCPCSSKHATKRDALCLITRERRHRVVRLVARGAPRRRADGCHPSVGRGRSRGDATHPASPLRGARHRAPAGDDPWLLEARPRGRRGDRLARGS